MKLTLKHQEKMHFEAEIGGHRVSIDTKPAGGGEDRGPQPKSLTLASLAGCTAMDVIGILRKMRAEPDEFWMDAEADVSDDHPRVFTRVRLVYHFKGGDVTREKAEKAVHLSHDTYCGVSAMLEATVPIESEIVIHE